MSANCIPHALSALAVDGSNTRVQPSSRAMGKMFSPAAPPPATRQAFARIDTLLHGDLLDGPNHQFICDRHDAEGGLHGILANLLCNPRNRFSRRFDIQRHRPADKEFRIHIAQHDRRVRHGGFIATSAVTCRAGIGPGALRANPKQSRRHRTQAIDPPPAPTLRTSTVDMLMRSPSHCWPSQVSLENTSSPPRTSPTSKVVPPASQTIRSDPSSSSCA